MANHESAWKQMLHFYRTEHQEKRAPMLYGDIWLQTKSHQRLVLGLTDTAKAPLTTVSALTLPAVATHLNSGDPLLTITVAGQQRVFTSPFGGTVLKVNESLLTNFDTLITNDQQANWLVTLKAD